MYTSLYLDDHCLIKFDKLVLDTIQSNVNPQHRFNREKRTLF